TLIGNDDEEEAAAPPSPLRRGAGGGSPSSDTAATPLPNPPPQGGREQTQFGARARSDTDTNLPHDEISDISEPRRERRHRPSPQPITLGVTASMEALDRLLREGRAEFRETSVWTPHRPPRPEKTEGGVRFVIKS